MIYKILPTPIALNLMDWATENGVDYDIWNAAESIQGSPLTEIGLERWPNQNEGKPCGISK